MTARVTAPWMVGRRDQPDRAAVLLGTLQGSQGWKLNLVRQGPKRQQWPGRKPSRPYHGSVWWRVGWACDSRLRDERSALNGWDRATGRDRRDGHGATPAGPA